MDEITWLNSADPLAMLDLLGNQASERKLRLFACACCRRVWDLLTEQQSRDAVEAAELYAEGALDEAALTSAWLLASQMDRPAAKKNRPPSRTVASAAACAALPDAFQAARECSLTVNWVTLGNQPHKDEWQGSALRDIFGNPFQPFAVPADWHGWNNGTIPALARAAYEHCFLSKGAQASDWLAVLADALEEVGCTDAAVLGHLRRPAAHFRGCHVLDALLGLR
jgi:hypothetical protein